MEFKTLHGNTKIITLCGSSKLKNLYLKAKKILSLKGYIVFDLPVYSHYENIILTETELNTLIRVHQKKIKMSDIVIFLLNDRLEMGETTYMEYQYALLLKKDIFFIPEDSVSVEAHKIQSVIALDKSKYLVIAEN